MPNTAKRKPRLSAGLFPRGRKGLFGISRAARTIRSTHLCRSLDFLLLAVLLSQLHVSRSAAEGVIRDVLIGRAQRLNEANPDFADEVVEHGAHNYERPIGGPAYQ